jgi:hypothetical protein
LCRKNPLLFFDHQKVFLPLVVNPVLFKTYALSLVMQGVHQQQQVTHLGADSIEGVIVGVAAHPAHLQALQQEQSLAEAQLGLEAPAGKRKGGHTNGDQQQSTRASRGAQQESDLEERERKRQRRLLQNRQSAALSRQRKKEYLGNLERRTAELEAENKVLKQQIYASDQRARELEQKLAFFAKQNEDLKALLRTSDKSEEMNRVLAQAMNTFSSLALQSGVGVGVGVGMGVGGMGVGSMGVSHVVPVGMGVMGGMPVGMGVTGVGMGMGMMPVLAHEARNATATLLQLEAAAGQPTSATPGGSQHTHPPPPLPAVASSTGAGSVKVETAHAIYAHAHAHGHGHPHTHAHAHAHAHVHVHGNANGNVHGLGHPHQLPLGLSTGGTATEVVMPEMLTNEQHTINGGGEAAVEVDSLAGLNGLGAGDSVEGQGPPVPNPDKTDEGMTVSGLSGEPLTNAEAAGEAASESAAAVQGLLYDEHSHTPGRHSHDDQPADTAEPAVMGEAQVPGGEDEGQVGVQHGTDLGTVPSLPGLEAGAAVNEGMDSGDHLQHLKNGEEV